MENTNKKDLKLFLSTIVWLLAPSIYLLIRSNIITLSNVDLNILGQLEWFDLLDEILMISLTIPMYSLLKESSGKQNLKVVSILFAIYFAFDTIIALYISNITEFMMAEYATKFLLLQTVSLLFQFATTLMFTLFIINTRYKALIFLTFIKLVALTICDSILIPNLLEYGASFSEIIVNFVIAVVAVFIGFKTSLLERKSETECESITVKSWVKVGFWSALQIFLDNFIYFTIIVRMVNAVSESGNYWMANNFIYGYLLIPVTALGELIRKNKYEKLTLKNTWIICIFIALFWFITIPLWKPFINHGLGQDASVLFPIILPLSLFYLSYIVCNVIDSFFVSRGKTIYTAIISLIVNIVYYGIMYLLFKKDIFTLNIAFIITLFGCGMIVHMICSIVIYFIIMRRNKKKC